VLGLLGAEGLIELRTVTHDGTKIAADAGGASFRSEAQVERHLQAARCQAEAMGAPDDENATARQRSARERAGRERIHRLERALVEIGRMRASKPRGRVQASKQQIRTSTSDADARIMRHTTGHYALSYNVQVSTDAAAGIVLGVAVGQTAPDYEYLMPAMDQVGRRLGRPPMDVPVDAGYTSRENVLELHTRGVDLVGPWVETDGRARQRFARAGVDEGFLPARFRYDGVTDSFTCPEGKRLKLTRPARRTPPGRVVQRYLASQKDCWACPSRSRCCSSNKRYGRSIVVTTETPAMRAFRAMQGTPELRQRMGERASGRAGERARVAEFVHAWLKSKLGLRRFHVRGLVKVGTEALWATLTYKVQQWIRLRWRPRLAAG
jgi:hypothetical protein